MVSLDYTDCVRDAPFGDTTEAFAPMPDSLVQKQFSSNKPINPFWRRTTRTVTFDGNSTEIKTCHLQFDIPEDMQPPVLNYYSLTNFYQNHRRYVASFFDRQLKGDAVDAGAVSSSTCTPLTLDSTGKPYYPCGLIANSMFNDTINNPVLVTVPVLNVTVSNRTYVMTTDGISWDADRDLYGNFPSSMNYSDVVPPPNWRKRYPKGYNENNPPPNLKNWNALHVWMRTAALPTFSKLYQRNDTTAMQAGTYTIAIDSGKSYPFPSPR